MRPNLPGLGAMPKERNKGRKLHDASAPPLDRGNVAEDQRDLQQILDSFASERVAKHSSQVQAHVERLRDPESKIPPNGTRVLISGNNSFSGRYAIVIGRDGARAVVQVEGQTDLCRLTLSPDSIEEVVVEEVSDDAEHGEAARDFSDIHAIATEHARRNARREVLRMAELAEERRRAAEQTIQQPAQSRQVKLGKVAYRQRCKFGADCAKPGCRSEPSSAGLRLHICTPDVRPSHPSHPCAYAPAWARFIQLGCA